MAAIPREPALDSSLALLREGYTFITRRCERHGTDLFRTRLQLQDTICMRGEAAARLIYDESLFQRAGAAPGRLQKVLTGRGGVQGLDDEAHRVRKQMFMSLMEPEAIQELVQLTAAEWERALGRWQRQDRVVLHAEVREILCRAVCRWAGVPLTERGAQRLTRDLGAMIDGAPSIGPGYLRGRLGRLRTERWARGLIERKRSHGEPAQVESALGVIAWHRDHEGRLLDPQIAAVELLNVLRPVVAVARFITFAALELWKHPQWHQALSEDDAAVEAFAQEVRRLYAFFPFIAAVTRKRFEWQGYEFPENTRVLLDLYGTNRDSRSWEAPEAFRPERFERWDGNAYSFITQGGGEHMRHHRCAGEWISIELTKVGIKALTRAMRYAVPSQDLRVDLARLPMLPRSGFVIDSVRAKARVPEVAAAEPLQRPSAAEAERLRRASA